MKLAVISDIHLDINKEYPVAERLASMIKGKADGLIIAGDITENAEQTIRAVKDLEELAECPVWYVPGNHDMWNIKNAEEERNNRTERLSSDEIYQLYCSDLHCLCQKPQLLNGKEGKFVLLGDIGWYDYSFADKRFSEEELDQMSYEGRTWQDYWKNQWTKDNKFRLQMQLKSLENQLIQYRKYPAVIVTHMLPVWDFCVQKKGIWEYFNAFLGSAALGELFERYQVRYSISGHVHYRKEKVHEDIIYICPCLGYHTEWPIVSKVHAADLDWQLKDALRWIEL